VSKYADLDGPLHYLDFGGQGSAMVCVHGLAGSALNWMSVGKALAADHRVLAPDLRGFGRTPMGPGTRLRDNERLVDLFLREVAGTPAIVVANSMAGLLAVRQAAAHPETVEALVLVDPALPWRGRRPFDLAIAALFGALLTPGIGGGLLRRRARRWGAERVVQAAFQLCCADPSRLPRDVVRAHVEQQAERMTSPRSQRALAQAARSLLWALARRGHAVSYQRVRAPVLIVHGDRDRLVPVDFSRAIVQRFGWDLEVLPDVGHLPMLEAPDDFVRVTLGWLGRRKPALA